jgi:5-methylcytosine-specific restriction endonuclease McrA
MSRSVPEWIGATPDAKIPARVRLRVFERFGGVCQLSARKIRPGDAWEVDHIQALTNGGEHRESNLQPVLKEAHKAKTREDLKQKKKDARVRKRHLGLAKPKAPLPGSRGSKWKKKVGGGVVRREEN